MSTTSIINIITNTLETFLQVWTPFKWVELFNMNLNIVFNMNSIIGLTGTFTGIFNKYQ